MERSHDMNFRAPIHSTDSEIHVFGIVQMRIKTNACSALHPRFIAHTEPNLEFGMWNSESVNSRGRYRAGGFGIWKREPVRFMGSAIPRGGLELVPHSTF